ncbi:hypothetical protein [Cohnella thailandensis]|uniref:DUF4367 domain-containing protein n=1 Tax=Cohnella thailandensis TaxID=557557 RepID=A0A841T3Y0_9BACL|nr:hypothetical protein [Cohnella thailandensis]MBB6637709.1 hypothetical protein [Cohnella thailandensis]MBP1974114.1 hypothetical protein [Cohnella thailandensis]
MQDEFDRLFDAAFDEAAKKHTLTPSSDRLWEKTEKALRRRKNRRRRLRSLPLVALSFMFGALLFGSPKVSDAFEPFFEKVISFPEGVVRVIFGTGREVDIKPKTPAPPPELTLSDFGIDGPVEPGEERVVDVQNAKPIYSSWEEVEALHGWAAPDSSTIPSEFKLKEIFALFYPKSSILKMATGNYVTEDGANFTVAIRQMTENDTGSSTYREKDGQLEQVNIRGFDAFLFITYEGYASLEWRTGVWAISINGKLDRESILAIGNGIE